MARKESCIKIAALVVMVAYTGVILGLWTNANRNGYTYFQGGEPVKSVKYGEWLAGISALIVGLFMIKEEADKLS